MNPQALVSIITVNFRNAEVTCALLDSIRNNSYRQVEVIVVDNGSVEDRTKQFETHFPEVKVLVSEKNLGFAGGNNLGLRAAKGDYFFLVNNDTEFTDGLVEALLARFSTQGVGMAGPKIRFFDRPNVIQFAGFSKVNPFTARNRTLGKGEEDQGQYDAPAEMPYVHGAAMMVTKEVVERTGGMPEDYFLYYEELDWCEAIRKAGFRIFYEPAGLIYHKESLSVGTASPEKTYYLTRSRLLFMRRNASRIHLLSFALFLIFFTIPKWTLCYLLQGKAVHLRAFWKGLWQGIR